MTTTQARDSIAIVGMAVQFPGADDADALWELLKSGSNTLSQIPPDRFDGSRYCDRDQRSGRMLNTTYGNFMQGVDAFDNSFFHISPREARSMDPQQRLLLRLAYDALENAGYTPDATPTFDTDTFATFVGVSTGDYVHNLRHAIDVYYSTGTLQSFLSGKIAYAFGFSGPSMALDTACSSSLVAIHQACRALQNGDCNAALAGGVNVMTSPDMYLGLSRGHFLSETGQCRPWDASADGYCRSEGCGLFVLKRMEDAVAENDRILGVIRGIEVNQSGNARSITHPHVPTQVALFQKLINSLGVKPHDVSVVECHGTGTQAGDPAELEAIRAVFAVDRAPDNPLHITSVKANIGHAEAASGAASLAKLILMMREQTIPRHVSFKCLNPRIPDLSLDNVRIDTTNAPWESMEKRLALLTNFGASGSNAALLLEEYMPPAKTERRRSSLGLVVGTSCRCITALEKCRAAYIATLESMGDEDIMALDAFAYTATARRQLHDYRISASGMSKEEVLRDLRGAHVVEVGPARDVVFVFSGQGSQYLGMGAELYANVPGVTHIVDECDRILINWGFPSILNVFRSSKSLSGNPGDAPCFVAVQSGLFVLEYALGELWKSWGVEPCAVMGHSFGEIAALTMAGVLTLKDGLMVAATRARLISRKCIPNVTGMTSVRASVDDVRSLLVEGAGLEICCHNSGSSCTVGGELEALNKFEQLCAAQGVQHTRLDVPYAYHSEAMDAILDDLRALGESITFSAPRIPIISNVTGELIQPGDTAAYSTDYFARHCREPARFREAVADFRSSLDTSTIACCIELGPHPTTLSLLRGLQSNGAPLLLPSLRKDGTGLRVLCSTLSRLYCTSVPIRWRKVFADIAPEAELVDLPRYPFADTRFWVPYEEKLQPVKVPESSFAGPMPSEVAVVEKDIVSLAELILGHQVAGVPLCPASVYAELALSAARLVLAEGSQMGAEDVLELSHCTYAKALIYDPGRTTKLRIELSPSQQLHAGTFTISSIDIRGGASRLHCSGAYKRKAAEGSRVKLQYAKPTLVREIQTVVSDVLGAKRETFSTRTIYDLLFPHIVSYSEAYRTIQHLTINTSHSTAYAIVQLPDPRSPLSTASYVVHPIFVDTLFHVAGFLVNFTSGMDGKDAFICSQVDKIKVLPDLIDLSARYGVYASVVHVAQAFAVVDVYALEHDNSERRVVARVKGVRFNKVAMASLTLALKAGAGVSDDAPRVGTKNSPHFATHVPVPLVFNPIAVAAATPVAPLHERSLQDAVLEIISETSGTPKRDIGWDAQLSHLGIDSLMIWELVSRLQAIIPPGSVDTHSLACASTVAELVQIVMDNTAFRQREPSVAGSLATLCDADGDDIEHDRCGSSDKRLRGSTSQSAGPELLRIQDARSGSARNTPLVLIHDGSGLINPYLKLASLNCEVWGIQNSRYIADPALCSVHPRQELASLASSYVKLVTSSLWKGGPYPDTCFIGGWSFGGVVAFEMARQLLSLGVRVKGLILIDAPAPQTQRSLPDSVIDRMTEGTASPRVAEIVRMQMRWATHALVGYSPTRYSEELPVVFLRSREGADLGTAIVCDPQVRAFLLKENGDLTVAMWEEVLGQKVHVLDIPGDHFGVFEDGNAKEVSQRIQQAIRLLAA